MKLSIIQEKIYEIRGFKVMLDFDLAEIYGIETRALKQAVRRNMKRFEGNDFMFELTKDEVSGLQIVILNKGLGSNIKYLSYNEIKDDTRINMTQNIQKSSTKWIIQ